MCTFESKYPAAISTALIAHRTQSASLCFPDEAPMHRFNSSWKHSGTFSGVGFALPIDTVQKNVESMIEEGGSLLVALSRRGPLSCIDK